MGYFSLSPAFVEQLEKEGCERLGDQVTVDGVSSQVLAENPPFTGGTISLTEVEFAVREALGPEAKVSLGSPLDSVVIVSIRLNGADYVLGFERPQFDGYNQETFVEQIRGARDRLVARLS